MSKTTMIAGLLASTTLIAASSLTAQESSLLTAEDFKAETIPIGPISNAAFLAPEDANPAHTPFEGTLSLPEARMQTQPESLQSTEVFGRDVAVFPAADLAFVTVGDDLVPVTQDVIRGSGDTSYWDIIVQPGKVWSEPDDNGWSRASFPFALVESREGETHNGVATFLYRDGEVSNLRYQIVQQTAPFMVAEFFTATGLLPTNINRAPIEGREAVIERFEAAQADAFEIRPWSELEGRSEGADLTAFDTALPREAIVADGIRLGNTFYLHSCDTPYGPLPYCERQRFGVWSVTKSAAAAAAFLRLAEKYGPEIAEARVVDYVPEAQGIAGWDRVTFLDLLNMSSGMGYGSSDPAAGIGDPFNESYMPFYEAETEAAKLSHLLSAATPYPWNPGEVARYRDEDYFLLGVALDNYLEAKEGPEASIWSMLENEVYAPIGIHYAPINKTTEEDPAEDQPLFFQGYYPTLGDLAKLSQLYGAAGVSDGAQILNAELLSDVLAFGEDAVGLPTYREALPNYRKSFWLAEDASQDCRFWAPLFNGWGKNYVLLLPSDLSVIRLANSLSESEAEASTDSLVAAAHQVADLCH